MPGPRGLPLFGNVFQLWGRSQAEVLLEWRKLYGPVFQYHLFSTAFVVISDKDGLKEAMVERGDAFAGRLPWRKLNRHVPVKSILDGAKSPFWKTMRVKTLQALKIYGNGRSRFEDNMHSVLARFSDVLRENEGEPRDYYQDIYRAITAFIATAVSGNILKTDI